MTRRVYKPFFALFMVILASISAAYGASVSEGGGISINVSTDSSAQGVFKSNGVNTQSTISSSGVIQDLELQHSVSNMLGDLASVGITANNVVGFYYNYDVHPGEGSGFSSNEVWAQQWLKFDSAENVKAYAKAKNSDRDEADATLEIDSGSLNGYYSAAYAGQASWLGINRGVFVQQIADHAQGKTILARTWAQDTKREETGTQTKVNSGTLIGYSAVSSTAQYTNDGHKAVGSRLDLASASALTGSIDQRMWAYDYWGDTSQVQVTINKGNLYSAPYSSSYPSIASAISDYGPKTYASQSYSAEAIGSGSYINRIRYTFMLSTFPKDCFEKLSGQQRLWDICSTDD